MPPAALLERLGWAALLSGALVSQLWMAENGVAPEQRPLSLGLAVWPWLSAFHLGVAGVVLVTVALAGRRIGARAWPGRALTLLILAMMALVTPAAVGHLREPAIVGALLALAVTALYPARWAVRGLGVVAAALGLAALWPPRTAPVQSARPVRADAPPLLVVGLDGADWDWIEPLLARGELPHLAALRARGAWGVLRTRKPTLSPILWTTISTGRTLEHHGIDGFVTWRLPGVDAPFPELRPLPRLGTGMVVHALRLSGVMVSGPISSDARRVPAYWNLATRHGAPVNVVDWWATWPAETVLGSIVSETLYYRPIEKRLRSVGRVTYPEHLAARLAPELLRPETVPIEEVRRFLEVTPEELLEWRRRPARESSIEAQICHFLATTENDRRVAMRLTEEGRESLGRPPDLLVLFRLLDMVGHTSLRYSELVDDHLGATPEQLRRYGRVVSEAHRTIDRALGELVAAFGPGANVLVVSDHGFELQSHPPENTPSYDHRNGAAGVLLAAGPAFRPGRFAGLSILDVMPLMVELKGFPLADDLDGRRATLTMGDLFVPRREPQRVASYGEKPVGPAAGAVRDPEGAERLKALGYVQ